MVIQEYYQRFPGGSDQKLIKLLETLYSYTTTSLAETPDDLFELTLGVRQGGPESPPLYNLYVDYVMRVFMIDETFRRFHLTINETKTKTMTLNYQYINQDISSYPATICFLQNICIENVTKFRYLGDMIVFNEPSTGDTEVELRIEMAENKFYELSKTFMNFTIRLPTRIKILNAA